MTLDTKIVRRNRYMVALSGLLLALASSWAIACMGDEAAEPDNDCPSGRGEPPQVQTNDSTPGQGAGNTPYSTMDGGAASGSGASGSGANSGGSAEPVGRFNPTPSDIDSRHLALYGSWTSYDSYEWGHTKVVDHFAEQDSPTLELSGYHHGYWVNTSCFLGVGECGPIVGSRECWGYPDGKQICMTVPN